MKQATSYGIDCGRLCQAARHSRQALERPRLERFVAVRQYLGQHYTAASTPEKVPVNLIAEYVRVVGRSLIAKNPRVLLSTFDRQNKPIVSAMQSWANTQIVNLRLQEVLARVVVDALFSVGICKIALCDPARAAASAWNQEAALPFAEGIDLDDWVHDVHGRSQSQWAYCGHRYRVPLETVRDSNLYSKDRKNLKADTDRMYNEQGDERISLLGRGTLSGNDEELEDMVTLWEFYIPRHRLVLTLRDDAGPQEGSDGEPLRVQSWVGPDCGPYHMLGYGLVPGSSLPKGPIQDLKDLHDACNAAYRKVVRIVERIKEVTFVEGSAAEDAERLMNANDGDIIPVRRPDALKQVVSSGQAIQQVLAVAMHLRELFSRMGGNIDLLGGQGPQSRTASQDKLLNDNAGLGLADMQATTIDYVGDVVKSLCWYWHHDPMTTQSTTHSLKGLPHLGLRRSVTPPMRQQVPWETLDIEVDPYSMQHQTPQTKLALMNQVVTQIIVPMMQLLVQSGVSFDANAYLKKISEFADLPDMDELLTIQTPPEDAGGRGGTRGSSMPIQTERTYNRVSTPGRTQRGADQQMMASMLKTNLGGSPSENGAA